jgi:hypothetical protein
MVINCYEKLVLGFSVFALLVLHIYTGRLPQVLLPSIREALIIHNETSCLFPMHQKNAIIQWRIELSSYFICMLGSFFLFLKHIFRLWTREEKEIAIVSHSGFLFHTLSMYGKECHPTVQQEVSKQ